MKTFQTWSDKVRICTKLISCIQIQDADGNPQPIYDTIFTEDGAQLIATAGAEVLVYEAQQGHLIKALKGHKDTVLCLASLRGNGFASGGADNHVIIWNKNLEATLKYSHNDTIQALAQNPVSNIILSCTSSDFGLWAPELKNINKTKV